MKKSLSGTADLLLLIVSLVFIQRAHCEMSDPIASDEGPYLKGSFPSFSVYNRTLKLMKVHGDNVYLAGNNAVFHLSEDLKTVRSTALTEGSDYVYKILAVSETEGKLVLCISGNGGSCLFRDMSDVNVTSTFRVDGSSNTVSPAAYTTVGLLAPNKDDSGESLYVANGVDASSDDVKPILERDLQSQSQDSDRETTGMSSAVDGTFVIRYSGTFEYEGFVYFLASQRRVASVESSEIVPKLSRVCTAEDSTFNTFTEIKLGCRGKGDNYYSITQSLWLHEDRLFVVFNENTGPENEINPGPQSALCIYNMTVFEEKFREAVDACACDKDNGNNNNYLQLANCNKAILGNVSNPLYTLRCLFFSFLSSVFIIVENVIQIVSECCICIM